MIKSRNVFTNRKRSSLSQISINLLNQSLIVKLSFLKKQNIAIKRNKFEKKKLLDNIVIDTLFR